MKRLFITGIPTAGKSYLSRKLAEVTGAVVVELDDLREGLASDERYAPWVNFYLNKDEKEYLTTTSAEEKWQDLVRQSEELWPAYLAEIERYEGEERMVIFESVNILPHLAKGDLSFSGLVLVGRSYAETLERNKKDPRWGQTEELQELEARHFFEVERPRYIEEAGKYGYPVYESAEEALGAAVELIN